MEGATLAEMPSRSYRLTVQGELSDNLAAQKTTRAWNEWLAAGGRERPELYRCYVCALAEEEQAAVAIERAVNLTEERSVSSALTAQSGESRPSYL